MDRKAEWLKCRSMVRRARKEHRCTERSYHTIRIGDVYLHAEMPPWHECNDRGKYQTMRACLRCAREYHMMTKEQRDEIESMEAENAHRIRTES